MELLRNVARGRIYILYLKHLLPPQSLSLSLPFQPFYLSVCIPSAVQYLKQVNLETVNKSININYVSNGNPMIDLFFLIILNWIIFYCTLPSCPCLCIEIYNRLHEFLKYCIDYIPVEMRFLSIQGRIYGGCRTVHRASF